MISFAGIIEEFNAGIDAKSTTHTIKSTTTTHKGNKYDFP